MPTSTWSAKTDGASNMTSSAYKNIAVQIARILHPTYSDFDTIKSIKVFPASITGASL